MTITFQLVDSDDALLFDLFDPTGASNPHSLKTALKRLDLGEPNREATLFSPSSIPGAIRARLRHGAAFGQAILRLEATNTDDLEAGYSKLARLVELDGVALKFSGDGQTDPWFFDLADAFLDRFLRGEEAEGYFRFNRLVDLTLGLSFVRQPFARLAELDSDTNKLTNPFLFFDSDGDDEPDEWTTGAQFSSSTINASDESLSVTLTGSGVGYTQDFVATATGTWTLSGEVAVSGAFLRLENVTAVTSDDSTVAASPSFARVTDASVSATSGDTLRVHLRGNAASAFKFRRIQLENAASASPFIASPAIVPNIPLAEKTQAPIPPVASDSGIAGNLSTGTYSWKVSFVTAAGETLPSSKSNVVDFGVNRKADLIIPVGQTEVTQRKIYRTTFNEGLPYKFVATVADNTTTTYQDNTADASLGAAAPTANTTAVLNKIGRYYSVYNGGDADAPFIFELKGDSGASIQSAHLASLSALEEGGKSLTGFLNSPPVIECEDADITGALAPSMPGGHSGGTVVTDPDASSDQAAQYVSGTFPEFRRLVRAELTDTDELEGYRGTFTWKLRLRYTGKAHGEFQLRWADSLEEPAPFTNLPVRHNTDIDGLASFGYVEINLGMAALPTEGTLEGLALEVWGQEIVAGTLLLDCLIASPTEQSATVALSYTGRSVVGEDNVKATLGNKLGANTWRVTWRYSVQAPNASFVIALRVRRDTQDSGTIVRELQKDHPNDITNVMASLEFTSLDTVSYFADTDTFAGSATITVHEIIVEKVNWLALDEVLETNPSLGVDRARKLTTTGRSATTAVVGGPVPFWLPPGLSLIYVDVSEPRIGGLYSELKSELRRRPTLSHSYSPRRRA